jgi:EAL domain-containing protein (putative c-di-GMP-specific phosphodiesterase class I)
LGYLKRFPIDKLKVDQSFVRDIPNERADMEIVAAVISLAKNLRLDVLAEGVETQAQLEALRAMDCRHAQGYLFSKPVPADQIAPLLQGKA